MKVLTAPVKQRAAIGRCRNLPSRAVVETKKHHMQHAKKLQVCWGAWGGGGGKAHARREGRAAVGAGGTADQSFIINKNPIGALNRDQCVAG